MIDSFESLTDLYNNLIGPEETDIKMTGEAFIAFKSRTDMKTLFMLDGKLTAAHGIDYNGEYVQQIYDGRLITFRPMKEVQE